MIRAPDRIGRGSMSMIAGRHFRTDNAGAVISGSTPVHPGCAPENALSLVCIFASWALSVLQVLDATVDRGLQRTGEIAERCQAGDVTEFRNVETHAWLGLIAERHTQTKNRGFSCWAARRRTRDLQVIGPSGLWSLRSANADIRLPTV
jgi:hypothetical protein